VRDISALSSALNKLCWILTFVSTLAALQLMEMSAPRPVLAQAPDGPAGPQPKIKRAMRLSSESQRARIDQLTSDGDKEPYLITLDRLTRLMIKDLDQELSAGRSPLAVKGVAVRAPLSSAVADWLDARVLSALHQSSRQRAVVCISCRAQVTSLSEEAWSLKQGLSSAQDIQRAAAETGARSLLDLSVAWSAERNRVELRARLFSAEGDQLWSRDYRSDAEGKARRLARPGEAEGDSSDRYEALALNFPPRDDNILSVFTGLGLYPSAFDSSTVNVFNLGVGWGERFGDQLKYRYALSLDLSVSTAFQTFVSQLGGEVMTRLRSAKVSKTGDVDTAGLWLGGGASLNYVFLRQGVGAYLLADWISSIGLGLRLKGGYQFAFGDLEPDLSGSYVALGLIFAM